MKEQIELRLKELKAEFESGQKIIADLGAKETNLRNTLLQISGAIQVLEELLESEKSKTQVSEKSEELELEKVVSE